MTEKLYDLKFFHDPGHAWLKVSRHLIPLDILRKVSSCSYQRLGFVYLEEDVDAPMFIERVGGEKVIEFTNVNSNERSEIRKYNSFVLLPNEEESKDEN